MKRVWWIVSQVSDALMDQLGDLDAQGVELSDEDRKTIAVQIMEKVRNQLGVSSTSAPERATVTPTDAELDPCSYMLPELYHHIEVSRTFMAGQDKPWYIVRGSGRGDSADYWSNADGWVNNTPSRYETAQKAARAFLSASRSTDGGRE